MTTPARRFDSVHVFRAFLATLLAAQATQAATLTVITTVGDGPGSFRQAIMDSNTSAQIPDTIHFAIPPNDPGHFYYQDDGVAGKVTPANRAMTSEANDAAIQGIDPDWPHSWYSIQPASDLPSIDDTVFINGYSQSGASRNTNPAPGGLNTVLKIEIDGTHQVDAALNLGLLPEVSPSNNRIEGLAVNRSPGGGITLDTFGGNGIAGCFIGTDISGMVDLGNSGNGVYLNVEENNLIGGTLPEERNLISGNGGNGFEMYLSRTGRIQGNLIGTDRAGEPFLPNQGVAIAVFNSAEFRIGGTEAGAENKIVFGASGGITIANVVKRTVPLKTTGDRGKVETPARRLGLQRNYVFPGPTPAPEPTPSHDINTSAGQPTSKGPGAPVGLAIDLGADGVTANDGDNPGTGPIDPDSDMGPNDLQNYPVLTTVTPGDQSTMIEGSLESRPSSSFRIEFYSSSRCHPSGHGFAERFLGSTMVTTSANGLIAIMAAVPGLVAPGEFITSTATWLEPITGHVETSEFSACLLVEGEPGPCPTPFPDFATDGNINAKDLLLLFQDIRQNGNARDLTGDAKTDADDLLKFTFSWQGEDCSQGR